MKFCTECGASLNGSRKFCPNCGCNLSNSLNTSDDNSLDIEYINTQNDNTTKNDAVDVKKIKDENTLVIDKNEIEEAMHNNEENLYYENEEYIPSSSEIPEEEYIPESPSQDAFVDEVYDDEYYEDNEMYEDEYYDEKTGYVIEDDEFSNPSKPISKNFDFLKDKRNKTIAIAVAAIVAVFGISTFTYKQMNSPKKVLSKFEKAIDNKDAKALAKISASSNEDLEITAESVQPFIDYCSENSNYAEEIKSTLSKQVKEPSNLSEGEKQSDAVAIAESDGLFGKAVISIKPMNLIVESPIKGATITVSGKNMGTTSEADADQTVGPLVPGKHKLVGSYDSSSGNITDESDVTIIKDSSDSFPLFTKYKSVKIKGNDPEAIIYLDGKSTNIKIKDAEVFFPVTEDSELYAVGEKDGKKLESPKVKVKKQKYIQLNTNGKPSVNVDETEDTSGTPIMSQANADNLLRNLVDSFVRKTTTAVNTKDSSILNDHIVKDSDLMKDMKKFIDKYSENGTTFTLNDYKYNVKFTKDLTSGTLNCTEIYNLRDSKGSSETKSFEYEYEFEFNKNLNSYQFSERD